MNSHAEETKKCESKLDMFDASWDAGGEDTTHEVPLPKGEETPKIMRDTARSPMVVPENRAKRIKKEYNFRIKIEVRRQLILDLAQEF